MWKSLINIVLSEIGTMKLVVHKEEPETERTLPLLVGHWDKALKAPVVGCSTQYFLYVNFIVAEKSKQGFHRFSIMSCQSPTKHDIMMILPKDKVDIITKTVYVSPLHTLMILYLYYFSQSRYRSFLDTLYMCKVWKLSNEYLLHDIHFKLLVFLNFVYNPWGASPSGSTPSTFDIVMHNFIISYRAGFNLSLLKRAKNYL